jgi:hypothetical protein
MKTLTAQTWRTDNERHGGCGMQIRSDLMLRCYIVIIVLFSFMVCLLTSCTNLKVSYMYISLNIVRVICRSLFFIGLICA